MPDQNRCDPPEDCLLLTFLNDLQDLAARMINRESQNQRQLDIQRGWQMLTPRERQALELLRQGQSYKQIAHAWSVETATVRGHVSRALQKLGLTRRDWLEIPSSPIPPKEGVPAKLAGREGIFPIDPPE